MDKDRLPKLELDGFTYHAGHTPHQQEPKGRKGKGSPLWKSRAASVYKKFREPVKRLSANTNVKDMPDRREPDEVDAGYKRLLIKTGICAVIAITILVISSIDTPVTNSITEAIDDTINHEFDIDEDIGKLRFVKSLDAETQSVFSAMPETAVIYPTDGGVVTAFGDSGSSGVRFEQTGSPIVSIAKGAVTAVGTIDDMGYVKIELDAGETAIFYNVEPCVQVDDIVYAGQTIGDAMGDYLYLEMKSGDDYIDPVTYIEERASFVVQ